MIRHDEIRNQLAAAASDLGFDVQREVAAGGWPTSMAYGRVDLLIYKPLIVVEIKVDARQYDTCPFGWRLQLQRYTELFGLWSDRWLVSETLPNWSPYYETGFRVCTTVGFVHRLRRLADDGVPLSHAFKRAS